MISMKIYAYLGGAWVDITSDVRTSSGVSGSVGITGNKPTDRIARDGSLSFVLNNNDGKYTPGSGTAHADWVKGVKVKAVFTKYESKTKFIGRVTSIKPGYRVSDSTASVTALDWMHYASQLPLDIPALQQNKRADQIITTILGFSPIQPESTSLGTGTQTFPYAFHDNTVKTTAYSEITKSTMSEYGYSYVKQDGTLKFEPYGGRSATQKTVGVYDNVSGNLLLEDGSDLLLEDGTNLLLEDFVSLGQVNAEASTITGVDIEYGERIANRVSAQIFPYKVGENDVLVYTNEINQLIPAGQTVSFRIPFTDQSSKQPIAAISPSIKQYTLLHFDTPPDGVTDIQDEADQTIPGYPTSFTPVGAGFYTSIKVFGTASLGFNGSSDYIYSPSQEKFNPRAENWTVDWWEYRLTTTANTTAISRSTTGAFPPYALGVSDGSVSRVYITSNGVSWDIANGKSLGTIPLYTWTHYAIIRSGNTFVTFQNGAIQDTWTSSATIRATTDDFSIGLYNGAYYNGYIDEFRMIKGYAAWTTSFTPNAKQYVMSGINWRVYDAPERDGNELTSSMTATAGIGGTGIDFSVTSSSGTDGYLVLDIWAQPLQSLSPITHVAEDTTSINDYGYYNQNIEMRYQDDINFAKTVADAVVSDEKDPRVFLNKVSMITRDNTNEALFLYCDIGDLVRVNDSLSGYDALNHIQAISWRASPGNGGVIVSFDWILKEQ